MSSSLAEVNVSEARHRPLLNLKLTLLGGVSPGSFVSAFGSVRIFAGFSDASSSGPFASPVTPRRSSHSANINYEKSKQTGVNMEHIASWHMFGKMSIFFKLYMLD